MLERPHLDIYNPTNQTIDALMHLELPAGVELEVKMGSSAAEAIRERIYNGLASKYAPFTFWYTCGHECAACRVNGY